MPRLGLKKLRERATVDGLRRHRCGRMFLMLTVENDHGWQFEDLPTRPQARRIARAIARYTSKRRRKLRRDALRYAAGRAIGERIARRKTKVDGRGRTPAPGKWRA